MKLALIAAMTDQHVIGKDGRLPWSLPEDLKHFKALTLGHPLIMGRKTWDSLPFKPLPGRPNLVLSRDPQFKAEGAQVFSSLKAAVGELAASYPLAFVIGGEALFREALPLAERLCLTLVHHPFEGDTYFPQLDLEEGPWRVESRMKARHEAADGPSYEYEFLEATRS
jgi:dihydrofolate reductase